MGKIISNGIEYSGIQGTTVIANPEGTPTDELQTIQIGNDIYEIVGGSSGGSGGDILIKDRNWTLITSSFGTTQLTNTYDYYLWIVICNGKIDHYKIIDSSLLDLETNEDSIIEYKSWNDGQGAYSDSRVTITASSVTLWDNNQEAVSAKLYGANKDSSGGSASWTDVTGTLTAGEIEVTLSSAKLGANSTLDFYTSKFGINPIDVEINSGTETQLQEFVSSESELDGTISASSYLNDSYAPWKAFLDSTGYGWVGDNISEDTWLAYDFGTNVTISKVQWTCGDNSRRGILSKLQYSSDGTTWNDATLSTNERCNVILQTPTTARYWRMYYNAPFGSYQQPMVSQLRFLASGYSVTLTFEEQEENLGVKVRIY